jgi:hypothetical protein
MDSQRPSDKPMFSYRQVSVSAPSGVAAKTAVWLFLALIVIFGATALLRVF